MISAVQLHYPARFHRESGGGYSISFPDLPEALTCGDNLADAQAQAADCLSEALAGRIHDREEIPAPSDPRRGMRLIAVPLDLAPKVAVYMAMRADGVSNSELARRMGVRETIVRRILDPKTATRLETIERALAHLGKTATLTVANAA
jgi:antitoxin HicB